MSASNAFETSLLQHIFQNAALANVGDVAGLPASAAAGSLFVSLHTADPGETGSQTTSETAYTGYSRFGIARSGAGWTVTGPTAANAAAGTFPAPTASPGAVVTHFGIGTASTGTGNLLFSGALTSSYQPVIGTAPPFAIGAFTTTAD